MKIVLLPQWVKQSLEFANKPLTTALSLTELGAILSPDDVAFYYALNCDLTKPLPESVYQSLSPALLCDQPDQPFTDEFKKLVSTHQLASNTDLTGTWIGQLAEPGTRFAFTCDFLTDEAIAVSPYVLDDSDTQEAALVRFYERLIGQLCVAQPFEEVAQMEVFKAYLKLL